MMPNAASRFPRGYSGGQSSSIEDNRTLDGNKAVTDLWEDYVAPSAMTATWSFRSRALHVAMNVFTVESNWFINQDRNGYMTGYNFDFILDTLRFISTGRRQLSVHTWPDLVSHQYGEETDVSERCTLTDFMGQNGIPNNTVELLQKWCSQPGGIDDMVCTLNILFGDLTVKFAPKTL
jgi:hypothetical protein